MTRLFLFLTPLLLLAATGGCTPRADVPPGYPAAYSELIDAANREKAVTIYGTMGEERIAPIIAAFEARYPAIRVSYVDLAADTAFERIVTENDRGRGIADIVWTSAMDLQIKLVNDGYAQRYRSPERAALPSGLVWKDEAYGITAEPVVFAYNRKLLAEAEVPQTHAALASFLRDRTEYRGKVMTYDPVGSAVGFMFLREDSRASSKSWDLVRSLGTARAVLSISSDEMLRALAAGDAALAYNVIGSYAQKRQQRDDVIGFVVPKDYMLLISRIALISREAPHPNAARLFLDFLLSREGQGLLASQSVRPVRGDVVLAPSLQANTRERRTIRVGPALLTHLDKLTRAGFLRRWETAYGAAARMPDTQK